ncbi:MAG: transcription-repair coupling factor [Coriobacteriia bacterium]|nr:transcription-repair coupling factor [Coriobacteriia bacterium]
MLIQRLAEALFACKALDTLAAKLETGRDVVIGVPLSARPFLLAATYAKDPRPILVVVSGEEAAYLFARDLAVWLGNDAVMQLPLRTDLPWRDLPREFKHVQQVGQRARAIQSLAEGEPGVVVASARSLLRLVPPPVTRGTDVTKGTVPFVKSEDVTKGTVPFVTSTSVFAPLCFVAGEELSAEASYDGLSALLVSRGYERLDKLDRAEQPGSFALHGDTLDIYPAGHSYPVRVELFGEFVEVIRRLVPATGQSIGMLDSVDIYPARELALNKKTRARALREIPLLTGAAAAKLPAQVLQHAEQIGQGVFFNELDRYLPYLYTDCVTPLAYLHDSAMVALIEPRSLIDDSLRYFEELEASAKLARAPLEDLYMHPAQLDFGTQQRLTLLSLISGGANLDARLEVKHADTSSDERLAASVRSLLASRFLPVLGIADRRARAGAELVLSDAHLPFAEFQTQGKGDSRAEGKGEVMGEVKGEAQGWMQGAGELSRTVLNIVDMDFATSLIIPAAQIGLLSLSEGSGSQAVSRRGRSRRAVDPTSLTFPYKPGDYVVHATHGIALFKEIVRQEVAGIERDYLYLEYAHGDKLFTPVEQIDKITRYVGPESSAPRLTRLNTSDWSRATGKARKAAHKLAFDLVDLYARRSTAQGYAYTQDNDLQYEMELAFPYEETADQLAAIADVKADMESARPMDRLICGDVGFGKTEVALRAAFKAVQSGKQVMLLCPTTILAQQHYLTFLERFERFAVNVEVLSRFRTPSQQKKILEGFATGTVDVLVGTHRLLSSDVNPKDLGLIVVDEEQRFGVQHKEHLKSMREQVDVLTLSATPIPRTMQMAISGVRDMSLIDTPPASRTPIHVHVGEWDEDVVSAAIRREMERGGQVYYVSNRVKSIDDAVARVVATAPEARIGVAHGKLSGTQLEAVMEDFAANEFDVLVATTIIESGLDNPHTNTLIIEDSQRLGLAQLYQLKGRVGRSHAQAYAFFLFPSQNVLTEEAVERLTAIDEFQGLGSGMKIAMRDLEIRGAGSLLGAEQHGMLSAVGFDLFASMLQEAVLAARAGGAEDARDEVAYPEVRIDLPVAFLLPEEYVAAADERVLFYRRLAAAADEDAVVGIEAALVGGYGALPAPAQNLVDRARAKALAGELGITSVALQRGKLVLEPLELSAEQAAALKARGGLYLVKSQRLMYPVQAGVGLLSALINLLLELR